MKRVMAVVGLVVLLGGCDNPKTKPTDENYIATLNAYFPDHQDCLLDGETTFPYETSDKAKIAQMEALAKAQMVDSHSEPAIHVSRYTLTDAGIKAGAHLCYGHREVTGIVSSTAPAKANGFVETQVVYRYKIEDMPVWAKTPEVVAAFPQLAKEATGNDTGTITLALTGVGWSVPN